MQKIDCHIEIVSSARRGLSSMSQESRNAVLAVLSQHYTRVGVTLVNTSSDLDALIARKPDLVFLGMKFIPQNPELGLDDPNKIWISRRLDEHGIAYTGSNYAAHELEFDKPSAKRRVLDAGLATSPFCAIERNQIPTAADIPFSFPVFIKPTNRGGGAGIDVNSVAQNLDELISKVQSISTSLKSDSIVEEYLPGREFSVAILRNRLSSGLSAMPIELVSVPDKRGVRMLSNEVKSANTERALEVTDNRMRSQICTLAIDAFHALGARDYGRIDIRLDASGMPQFLEANLLPSLITGYGSFPKACMLNINLDYEPMVLALVRMGLSRKRRVVRRISRPDMAIPFAMPTPELVV